MKFLALKEALESLKGHESEPPDISSPDPIPKHPDFLREAKQHVVGGVILRTPIDKTAAMVVSKAPWWAQPPPEPKYEKVVNPIPPQKSPPIRNTKQKQNNHHVLTKGNKAMGNNVKEITFNHPTQAPIGEVIEKKSDDQMNAELVANIYKKADISVTEADRLVAKALDARAALDVMCDHWKGSWLEFTEQSDERLKQFRMFRMAFDTETKLLMGNLREVRQFFMDKQHDTEITRLREFVDMCERLKNLKESGFLDTVADTILKLA